MERTAATLLERETEMEILHRVLQGVADGRGGVVLIEGAAGIGKSSLLTVAREEAAELGLLVAAARGAELEREYPYGIARQLAAQLVHARPELIEGGGAAVGRLLRDEPLDPASAAFALSALVREAADVAQPLLVVDDAHWGDASSLSWLAQVAADARAMSVGVVVAARPAEPGATVQLEVFRAAAGVVIVRPRLLASASVGALVRTRLPEAEEDFCAACARASGGNPFLALSLVDGGDGSDASSALAPRLVRATTMVRVSRAGDEAVALAHAVAVLERSSRLDDAAALARLDLAAAVRAADQLRASEILADGPDLEFAHPLLRSAVYDDIPELERAERHREVAHRLAARGEAAETVAAHAQLARPVGDALVVEVLRRAAASSARRGAPSAAVALLERAQAEPPPPDARDAVAVELFEARVAAGADPRVAADLLGDLLAGGLDPWLGARAIEAAALPLVRSGRGDAFVPSLSAFIERHAAAAPVAARRVERVLLWTASFHATLLRPYVEHAARVAEELDPQRPEELALLIESVRLSALGGGDRAEIRGALSPLEAPNAAAALSAGFAALSAEQLDLADTYFRKARARALESGNFPQWVNAQAYLACGLMLGGNLLEAEALLSEVLARIGQTPTLGAVRSLGAVLRARRGRVAEALEMVELEVDVAAPGMLLQAEAEVCAAEVLVSAGRASEALSRARHAAETYDAAGIDRFYFADCRTQMARALALTGAREDARALALQSAEAHERRSAPIAAGAARLAAALSAERPDAGELAAVVSSLRGSGGVYQLAWALVELGAALRRAGFRREAREPLAEALDLAVRCGAGVVAARAREELAATGARPRRDMRTGVAALTASELRIARLAAEGRSNPEIAQELYVTRKTVETHLGRIFAKLDIRSRGQIGPALDEDPPAAGVAEATRGVA